VVVVPSSWRARGAEAKKSRMDLLCGFMAGRRRVDVGGGVADGVGAQDRADEIALSRYAAGKRPTSTRKRDRGRDIGQWKQAWAHDAQGLHFTHGGLISRCSGMCPHPDPSSCVGEGAAAWSGAYDYG
jgi:hypothetical protein